MFITLEKESPLNPDATKKSYRGKLFMMPLMSCNFPKLKDKARLSENTCHRTKD